MTHPGHRTSNEINKTKRMHTQRCSREHRERTTFDLQHQHSQIQSSEHRPRPCALSIIPEGKSRAAGKNQRPPSEQNATRNFLKICIALRTRTRRQGITKTNRRRVVCRSNAAAVLHLFSSHSIECTSAFDATISKIPHVLQT